MIIFIISSKYAQKYLNKDFKKNLQTTKSPLKMTKDPDVWSGYDMVQTHPSFTIKFNKMMGHFIH